MSGDEEGGLTDAQAGWAHRGRTRPDFAIQPGEGQESVWDYPRPPAIAPDRRLVEVHLGATRIAHSTAAVRVLETASPPAFYVPRADVDTSLLAPALGRSRCEWKGEAQYWRFAADPLTDAIAWSYPKPYAEFAAIADFFSFYPALVTATVAGEPVRAQPGGFYGGWVTAEIVGPFKGDPGTGGW